ncbi:AraC family transcriptional regulator [Shewanella kaireitica]|uniref:AraC family transcriptional regulator n=1 Tax=Shewanella kaireitica TaxID=212021 RepID=UPI00200E6E45|nr:AraC family transcriptional regulator [Shewanella kaireitica]MCL1093337.1 AraC family transcriptional regulator [Shewanella kaireitica]
MTDINSLLAGFHLNATIFHRSLLCNTWSTDTSGSGLASFHLVSQGQAYLYCDDIKALELTAGDLVVFPHDAPHIISSSDDAKTAASIDSFIAYPMALESANQTGLICGYFDFSEDKSHPLICQLPTCMVIHKHQQQGALAGIVQSLIEEAKLGILANEVILSRLSEVFFLNLIRKLSLDEQTSIGLFKALQDPKMNKVLHAINTDLAHSWTVNTMAEIGGYSRASFASYFKSYLEMTPLEYLTRLRLSQAQKQLRAGDSVYKTALDVGYQTDVSFAKAFKRYFGYGPGSSRKNNTIA